MLAWRRQTTRADVWRNPAPSGNKTAAPAPHTTGVLLHISAPDARGWQLLQDWGTQKATMLAELARDADVTEGDELHVAGVTYQVERAVVHTTMLLCAVWQVRGITAAPTPGSTRTTWAGQTRTTWAGDTRTIT